MKLIGSNNELVDFLSGDYSILSSRISQTTFRSEDGELIIEIDIDLLYSQKEKKLKLRFTEIEEYSFYYNSQHIFYNIEHYKFLSTEKGMYISFDPFDEEEMITPGDQDFIMCSKIEGYLS